MKIMYIMTFNKLIQIDFKMRNRFSRIHREAYILITSFSLELQHAKWMIEMMKLV